MGEEFACGYTDACFQPPCTTSEQAEEWADLVGMKCDPDAINAVLMDYPGLNVACFDENALVTKDFRQDRVRIFYNSKTGNVSKPPEIG